MSKPTKQTNYNNLIKELASVIDAGRATAVRYVNTALVVTYWLVGRKIVEFEQQGKERAAYGEQLLISLARDLSASFGRGFSKSNLFMMRSFYITYPESAIFQTLSGKSKRQKIARSTSQWFDLLSKKFPLSWSHYNLLLSLDEPEKRDLYEAECIKGGWSVRQLDRQISSMLYERIALSKKKIAVLDKAHQKKIVLKPEDEIKDPYILEFLNLKDEYSESELEEALIKHLEQFLLELGIGFTFVARQKRIVVEGSHFRIDLLLYHRVLKCLVAIDLKLDKLTPGDAGQMNFYLNYLKVNEKLPGENDPVGIILCAGKKKTVVEYALGGMTNKIFTSKYKLKLPDPKKLQIELEHERKRLEGT